MSRITKWLLFGVVCSLLPILFKVITYVTRGQNIELTILVEHGELFLISTAIAATGLGELVTEGPKPTTGVILTAFSSFALTAVSAYWFSDLNNAAQVDLNNIVNASVTIFLVSLISTFICFKQTEVPAWRI